MARPTSIALEKKCYSDQFCFVLSLLRLYDATDYHRQLSLQRAVNLLLKPNSSLPFNRLSIEATEFSITVDVAGDPNGFLVGAVVGTMRFSAHYRRSIPRVWGVSPSLFELRRNKPPSTRRLAEQAAIHEDDIGESC